MALIKLEQVSKFYEMGETRVDALKDVSLEIEEQNFVAFVGPSGSGKTTLLNIIGCLDRPSQGNVYVSTTCVNDFSTQDAARFRGEHLGFIFQNFNLIPVLTVYENVEYPLIMVKNTASGERRERIMHYLKAVDMLDQKDKYPAQISGGQKQRVAVARALVTDPKLVLADEPTANLDHANAFKVIDLMRQMQRDFKTTFVFSTHDPKIVREAEIVFTLEDGQVTNKETVTPQKIS